MGRQVVFSRRIVALSLLAAFSPFPCGTAIPGEIGDPKEGTVVSPRGVVKVIPPYGNGVVTLFVTEMSERPGSACVTLDSSQVAALERSLARVRPTMTTPSRRARLVDPSMPVPDYVGATEPALLVSKPDPPRIGAHPDSGSLALVRVLVSKRGTVERAEVIEGDSDLREVALQVARGALFKPALSQRRPVASWVLLPVRFSVDGEGEAPRK